MNILDMQVGVQPADGDPPPSEFQSAIYSAVREADDHLVVNAVAGSGKTTTLMKAMEYAGPPALFLAFNKSIADEIRGRLSTGEAKTLNALGHRVIMNHLPGAKLEARKNDKLIEKLLPDATRRQWGYIISRIISTAKANAIGLEENVGEVDFSRYISGGDWDVDDEKVGEVAEAVARVFSASRDVTGEFDFDDQLYLPIYRHWDFPTFGTVLVDEAQDLNPIQHAMLDKFVEAGSRLIAVGDRHQAIYGFRGALHDSLDQLRDRFSMLELPLSISYRCSRAVVREAQTLVPHIQFRPGAPHGLVRTWGIDVGPDGWLDPNGEPVREDPILFPDGWLVVCRNNAPLFAAIMRHVRARKPCRVLSNALEGMQSFIRKFKTNDIEVMLGKLDKWLEKQVMAAETKGMPWKVAALEDKAATVRALSEGFHTVEEILNCIRQLSEGRSGPIFSTIHKAKGLEAAHVYFLRPDLVPGWWIREPAALQQEYNLRYVAITRAKDTLTYGVRES